VVAERGTTTERWHLVHELAAAIDGAELSLIPTYDRLLIEFDPITTDHDAVTAAVHRGLRRLTGRSFTGPARTFEVPVVYGGEHGPDLDAVAAQQGISPAQVVAIHAQAEYTVRCLGSPAGAPMMDGPFPRPVPRLASPRPRVPAGAVAVAGRQAVVSAMPAPGGWSVLGRTPLRLLDLDRAPPAAYRPGDRVRFRPISVDEWEHLSGTVLEPRND
jgi:KipI family sensor histidine kinase inhibitor